MNENSFPEFQIQPTADGCDTLYSPTYGETYHSRYGALFETAYVFLEGTGVKQRLAEGQPTRILEVGFGTGLNFWATAYLSRAGYTRLHYIALEKHFLPTAVFARLNHDCLPNLAQDVRAAFLVWRAQLPEPLPTSLTWTFGTIQLDLMIGDAAEMPIPGEAYDAIYQDAFSPKANPELWTVDFFARLYERLHPGGTLATYSVKGSVRRALQAVGFRVEKHPGPPGKREILAAQRPGEKNIK